MLDSITRWDTKRFVAVPDSLLQKWVSGQAALWLAERGEAVRGVETPRWIGATPEIVRANKGLIYSTRSFYHPKEIEDLFVNGPYMWLVSEKSDVPDLQITNKMKEQRRVIQHLLKRKEGYVYAYVKAGMGSDTIYVNGISFPIQSRNILLNNKNSLDIWHQNKSEEGWMKPEDVLAWYSGESLSLASSALEVVLQFKPDELAILHYLEGKSSLEAIKDTSLEAYQFLELMKEAPTGGRKEEWQPYPFDL